MSKETRDRPAVRRGANVNIRDESQSDLPNYPVPAMSERKASENVRTGLRADTIGEAMIENLYYIQAETPAHARFSLKRPPLLQG